jgi:photosystem II stability/assembly factor-like uncharacterized protein
MKGLLKILLILPLIFSSCEEEDNTPSVSPPTSSSVTTGYISTQNGEIFKTTDSGNTWTYVDGLYNYIISLGGGSTSNFNMMSFN